MNLLIDTNVVLDHLTQRKPHALHATLLFAEIDRGRAKAFLCATTLTTVHYLASKSSGKAVALSAVSQLLDNYDVAMVDRTVLQEALSLDFADFEYAVIYSAALRVNASAIVSRDIKGFKRAKIQIFTPDEMVKLIRSNHSE